MKFAENVFAAAEPGQIDMEVQIAIAAKAFGFTFINAQLQGWNIVVADDRVSPEAMVAGLCKAHAAGLASAIASARRLVPAGTANLDAMEASLLSASIAFVRQEIAKDHADDAAGSAGQG